MKVDMHMERLKKIKSKRNLIFRVQCKKCENWFVREKMWKVVRYTYQNDLPSDWLYCRSCCATKEDVLKEIDSDSFGTGIYGIDSVFPHGDPLTRRRDYA